MRSRLVLALADFGEDLPIGGGFEAESFADGGALGAEEGVGRQFDVDAGGHGRLAAGAFGVDFAGAGL